MSPETINMIRSFETVNLDPETAYRYRDLIRLIITVVERDDLIHQEE